MASTTTEVKTDQWYEVTGGTSGTLSVDGSISILLAATKPASTIANSSFILSCYDDKYPPIFPISVSGSTKIWARANTGGLISRPTSGIVSKVTLHN